VTPSVIVMGVSGCGKSTLGRAVAEALGWRFIEGDTLHTSANISKMAAGLPLNDSDRWPFLDNVTGAMARWAADGVVASCSALKRSYRDRIRDRVPDALFVLPMLGREVLQAPISTRPSHFMPATCWKANLRGWSFHKPTNRRS
jgi:gluconokinase